MTRGRAAIRLLREVFLRSASIHLAGLIGRGIRGTLSFTRETSPLIWAAQNARRVPEAQAAALLTGLPRCLQHLSAGRRASRIPGGGVMLRR